MTWLFFAADFGSNMVSALLVVASTMVASGCPLSAALEPFPSRSTRHGLIAATSPILYRNPVTESPWTRP
jgi:hypothetical protein